MGDPAHPAKLRPGRKNPSKTRPARRLDATDADSIARRTTIRLRSRNWFVVRTHGALQPTRATAVIALSLSKDS